MNRRQFSSIRKSLKLSQSGLAKSLGVSQASICRIESGIQTISKRTELALLYLLHLSESSTDLHYGQAELNSSSINQAESVLSGLGIRSKNRKR